MGTKTMRMAAIHISEYTSGRIVGPPRIRARNAFDVFEMGLTRANACSHPGSVFSGTNTVLANTRGNTHTKPADWAASTSRTARPMVAEIHDMAKPNPIASTHAINAATT